MQPQAELRQRKKNQEEETPYISESFTRAKALSFIVHKDALPKDIKNKLGIR